MGTRSQLKFFPDKITSIPGRLVKGPYSFGVEYELDQPKRKFFFWAWMYADITGFVWSGGKIHAKVKQYDQVRYRAKLHKECVLTFIGAILFISLIPLGFWKHEKEKEYEQHRKLMHQIEIDNFKK